MKTYENLTDREETKLDNYLAIHCTSRCGNDIDCPHVEEFIDLLNDEIIEKKYDNKK